MMQSILYDTVTFILSLSQVFLIQVIFQVFAHNPFPRRLSQLHRHAPLFLERFRNFVHRQPVERIQLIKLLHRRQMHQQCPNPVRLVIEQKIQVLLRHPLHRSQHLPSHKRHLGRQGPNLRRIALFSAPQYTVPHRPSSRPPPSTRNQPPRP